jgi:hypothetical protein
VNDFQCDFSFRRVSCSCSPHRDAVGEQEDKRKKKKSTVGTLIKKKEKKKD